ncbi:expressed unknown protein [Ectocarpus siliculosus]|uniref:Uncharacterized protein n=1 Tax=Ectocarpus siliculosus TaxID=2880 RepID=D7G0E3_ECTSI|nr:expressed unknown protein [Ectocarpus siliculosus]|eukprot:CBJ26670.1 expressed unknown protein [Ectocarpus siliculosus]
MMSVGPRPYSAGDGVRRAFGRKGKTPPSIKKLRVSDLEETVKRKANALKNANRRREQAQEAATSETAQAWRAAQLARGALEEAGRKRDSFREHARDAEARVKGLELKLEVSKAQAADAKQAASMELVARASAQERVCAEMKATVASAEKEQGLLRAKLEEALEGLWQKREAERETDKVIRELQAWRERVACGDVVEMSPSEVKRLRWSEEQGELLQEANATIRNQLLESGRLLAEAEHSFGIVTAGFEDAGTTITGLSVGLEKKKKELQEVEMALRASKSEASRLKKLRLSEQHRRLRGKERVLESTQKGMEALVRGRQKEIEARSREAVKRRDVEKVAANAAEEKALLQRRVEDAAERSRELYAERHVLLEHVAAARRDAASARSERTGLITSSRRVAGRSGPGVPSSKRRGNKPYRWMALGSGACGWSWRRHLAAQQCAEVRTELALALGRLSCRAMLVSDTRAAARRTSICNRTLLLRLVRSEMRLWRLRAAAAATEQSAREKEVLRTALTERGRPFFPPGEGDANPSTTYDKHPTNVCRSPDAESAAFTVNWGTDSEIEAAGDGEEEREDEEEDDDDDYGDGEEIERSIGGRGERRSRMQPKGNEGTGVERAKRKKRPAGAGFHLNLSGFDLDDETLHQVVRKLLRQCTDRSRAWPGAGAMYEQQGGAGEDGRNGQNTLSSSAIMPLRCLLLRGNNLTDAGALALVPLVEASSSLAAIDLRGNRIGTKGELALKKALTRSPWVYRVTSEEASGSDAREGSISTGGVVLRAKRRPMSTVRDRARAHAFKRIPPSNKTIPGKATIRPSPCSAGDDQPGEYHAGNDDGGRAPAHGSSIGCRQDENNDGQGASRQNCGSNLTPPTDMERLINTPIAASPICTIDLRGCSRRPLPLPLAAVGDFEQGERLSPQKPYPTVEGSPSEQQRHGCGGVGRGSDRHQAGDAETCVNQNTSSVPRRVHAASTSRGQDGQVTRLMRTGLAANLMGSSSRRPRYTGRRKPASRGEDCVFAPKSEAQELEDLTSLLSISRRIFSRAEGFEETHNLPEERRTQGATRAPRSPSSENGKRPDSSGTEPDTSKSGLPGTALVAGLGRSHSTNAPEETDKCGQMPSSAGKGDTTASTKAARAERPHDSREAAIEGEGYPADSAAPSGEAPPASVSATHPRDMQCDDRTPEVPTTAKTYPHEENRVVITGNPFPAEDFDAIACRSTDDPPHEPAAASPPPRAYPAICADARQTTSTTTEGESHYLEGAEKDADVDDAASAGDVQYSTYQNGEDGWIYDEATAAWYAVDPLSYGTAAEGLGDSGGGWRYDEQREAWYQDGPQESSCVLVPTPTHVDTENTGEKDHGATGEDRSGSRWRGSRRIPGRSLEALGSGVREKDAVRSTGMVESDASGAGGLIEKRIEALELALQDKGRPNDAWRDRKRAPP